jgi:hypothetical protein
VYFDWSSSRKNVLYTSMSARSTPYVTPNRTTMAAGADAPRTPESTRVNAMIVATSGLRA